MKGKEMKNSYNIVQEKIRSLTQVHTMSKRLKRVKRLIILVNVPALMMKMYQSPNRTEFLE
ncbi:hypothetical protein CHS0354_010759, partial [Potamilus streckersoni]